MNEISIVVPCISSLDKFQDFIDELAMHLTTNPTDAEVIVVANDKVRGTDRIVEYIQKQYPWLKFALLQRYGYTRKFGALARLGIAYSSSHYVALIPSYPENDIGIITKMLNKIREGAQVVQAARFVSIDDAKSVPIKFRLYQAIYRFLTNLLLGFKISDSAYGFKMFDRIFIQALGLNQNGYSICPEITLKAALAGGRIEYVPSRVKFGAINRDFKLFNLEGISYFWLLIRGLAHRIGILWF